MASVHLQFTLELSVQKQISSGASVCLLACSAPSSLSSVKEVMLSGKVSGSTYSMCSVPAVVLMQVLSATVLATRCLSVSLPLALSLNKLSSPTTSSPGRVCSSPFLSITRKMSLVGCDLVVATSLYLYLRCWSLSRESIGQSPASRTTAILEAVLNIPVTAHPCLLISF